MTKSKKKHIKNALFAIITGIPVSGIIIAVLKVMPLKARPFFSLAIVIGVFYWIMPVSLLGLPGRVLKLFAGAFIGEK